MTKADRQRAIGCSNHTRKTSAMRNTRTSLKWGTAVDEEDREEKSVKRTDVVEVKNYEGGSVEGYDAYHMSQEKEIDNNDLTKGKKIKSQFLQTK